MPSLGKVRTIMKSKSVTKILGRSPSMFKSRRSIMKGSVKTSAMRDELEKMALGPIGMLAAGLGLRGLACGIGRKLLGRAAKGAPGKILKRRAGQTLKMVKKPRARRAMRRGGTALEYGSMFAPSKAPAQPSQAQGVQVR